MTNDTRTVPAEKVEEVIATIDRNLENFSPETIRALLAVREDIAALLPPPPIVIEPGRYRMRNGEMAVVIEITGSERFPVIGVVRDGGIWRHRIWTASCHFFENSPHDFDIIAPWEDADDAY